MTAAAPAPHAIDCVVGSSHGGCVGRDVEARALRAPLGVLAIELPLVGWGAFAIGVGVSAPDSSLYGAIAAMLLGGLALLAAVVGHVLSIAGRVSAGGKRARSRAGSRWRWRSSRP